jgi:3-oxoacyl-[acyl-carrier protein] reductase
MIDLKGKKVIITGGARGIGLGIAEVFSDFGADIIVTGIEHDVEAGKEQEKKFADKGKVLKFFKADGSKPDEVKDLVDYAVKEFGQIDILINNAGITRDNLLMKMKEEDWDMVLNVNLKSVFNLCKAVIRPMMKAKKGKIINMSSVVGVMGQAGQANYSASKAGMIGFTKSLAKEVASRNITVNAIAPGFIETEMTKKLPDDVRKTYFESIPLKRFGQIEDVANTAAFIASSMADYVTGHVFFVDGGLVM